MSLDAALDGAGLTLAATAGAADGVIQMVEFLQGGAVVATDVEEPYELALPDVSDGCYSFAARATDRDGLVNVSESVEVTVGSCQQAPFLAAPVPIPGTIEAENFDLGGSGTAYADAANRGRAYRPGEGVDVERALYEIRGFHLASTAPGEWLNYTVDVESAGLFDVEARVTSASGLNVFHLELGGRDVTGPLTFEATGPRQHWRTVGKAQIPLEAGVQTLRLAIDSGRFSLDRLRLSRSETAAGMSVILEDFEGGGVDDWTFFGGNAAAGGGRIESDGARQGTYYLRTQWEGGGSESGFYGGFFKNFDNAEQPELPLDAWVNILVRNRSEGTNIEGYALELTLREDLNDDGWTEGAEDSHRLDTVFDADLFDDKWILVSAPLRDFLDLQTGGNGQFDGRLDEIVLVVSQVRGANPAALHVDLDLIAFSSGGPIEFQASTAVEGMLDVPQSSHLHPAYPNPFNATTMLSYSIGQPDMVRLDIFDGLGQKVRTLVDQWQEVGLHRVRFESRGLASGSYFYRLRAGSFIQVRSMLLLR